MSLEEGNFIGQALSSLKPGLSEECVDRVTQAARDATEAVKVLPGKEALDALHVGDHTNLNRAFIIGALHGATQALHQPGVSVKPIDRGVQNV